MRAVFICLCMTLCLLTLGSCGTPSDPGPRTLAPQEFSCMAGLEYDGFKARIQLTRTGNGEYTLRYLEPKTIEGLSYGWIGGETTRGLGTPLEPAELLSGELFPTLISAMERYYDREDGGLTYDSSEKTPLYVHKEFTISASPENGRILEIHFPNRGIILRLEDEML